jgi:DNA-binding CsgD family transcriptional regulator
VSPWIKLVGVVCSALSVAVVLGLDNAARRLARAVRSPSVGDGSELLGTLTEREIPKLFAQGLSYQEIGEVREISALTVRNAVSGVQRKLGFKTRQQMVVWAVRAGLVDGGSA